MKRYTFEIVIDEGQDEFWESIQSVNGSDEVEDELTKALFNSGFVVGYGTKVRLIRFEDVAVINTV